jgi:hypothetical protein
MPNIRRRTIPTGNGFKAILLCLSIDASSLHLFRLTNGEALAGTVYSEGIFGSQKLKLSITE